MLGQMKLGIRWGQAVTVRMCLCCLAGVGEPWPPWGVDMRKREDDTGGWGDERAPLILTGERERRVFRRAMKRA